MSTGGPTTGGEGNVLLKARRRRLLCAWGVDPRVSDDLAQLALLFNMNGEHDKALPLLHQRLNDLPQTESYQLRSLQVLYESAEPEDIESEDVPWEVYKRLKLQRGPSTAVNSVTLLKGSMRKCVMDVVYKAPLDPGAAGAGAGAEPVAGSPEGETIDMNAYLHGPKAKAALRKQLSLDADRKRTLRSQSDSTMNATTREVQDGESTHDRFAVFHADGAAVSEAEAQGVANEFTGEVRGSLASNQTSLNFRPRPDSSTAFTPTFGLVPPPRFPSAVSFPIHSQSIRDFPTLQQRVEALKRRILAGYPDINADVARLATDVDLIQPRELRDVGVTMVSLVREMNRLCVRSDSARQQLPVLEGMLEKKSASIFRGWEKRWFKVDPKTFILSYHFSKDDHARGFTPRGGFAVSRISNILVQRHARGSHFHFDVVVDLSTRLNPHGSRTYELRCEDEEALRYWVETLHYYKAMAQKTPPQTIACEFGASSACIIRRGARYPLLDLVENDRLAIVVPFQKKEAMEGMQGDSIVLEEEIDPNYEPTEKEVLEYATWLGMDLEAERDLFWIAREGLKASQFLAPLPENWKPCKTTDTEEIYYFNFATGQSTWDHPCDEFYRNLYEEHKKKHQAKDVQDTDEKKKKEKEDVAELLGRKSGAKKKKASLAKAEPLASDAKGDELVQPMSRPPLGSVLGRKPLLSSPSPLALPKDEHKLELDQLAADDELKRDKLTVEHADQLREVQRAHEAELEALRKKLKAQMEDVQEAEDAKLKQLRREFDKKKNDLESQFDREENTLQRSRKDQLKRLESETGLAIAHKKQELDRDFLSEMERLRSRHETKKSELKEEFAQEEKQLSEKLKFSFGEQKEAASAAAELKNEVERLHKRQKSLELELDSHRSEREALVQGKNEAETMYDRVQLEIADLRHQLETPKASVAPPQKNELAALRGQLDAVQLESNELKAKCAALQGEIASSNASGLSLVPSAATATQQQLELLERQYAIAQAEVASMKDQLSDAQDKLIVISKTNEQIKEQLMKEANEKKSLREQLESRAPESDTMISRSNEDQQQLLLVLQQQLESERAARKEREDTCDALRKETHALEQAKCKADADLVQTESAKRRLESDKTMLSRRLDALSVARTDDSASTSTEAALVENKREVQQLQADLKVVEADKEHLEARMTELDLEVEQLLAKACRLELERENERVRGNQLEKERDLQMQRQQNLSDELESHQQKHRALSSENADLRGQLSKAKLKEQSAADKAERVAQEMQELEGKIQNQQGNLELAAKESRAKMGQMEDQIILCSELRANNEVLQAQIEELKTSLNEAKIRQQQTPSSASGGAAPLEWSLLRDQLSEYEAKINSLVQSKAQLLEKNCVLVHKATEAESSLRNANLEKDQLAGELQIVSAELSKWKVTGGKASKEVESLTLALRELEAEKDLLEDSLRRETDQKNDLLRLKMSLANGKRLLEDEVAKLNNQVHDMESAQRSTGFQSQSLEKKLKRLESETTQLTKQAQTLQEDKAVLESSASRQLQEITALEGKIRCLKAENGEHVVRAQHAEEELSGAGAATKQLEAQLAEAQLKGKRESDEKLLLVKEVGVLTAGREELGSLVTSLKRRVDAADTERKEREGTMSRDDFNLKLKLQQAEVERENIVNGKERAEAQLKEREKELMAARDENSALQREIESQQARVKVLLSEKEGIQAALLNANLASATSSSAGRESGNALGVSTDAMLVKLQLADVNKHELELHLADISSQLEMANRRSAALESRCRDQSVDIESLHVEMASLRSASHKMHLSALESLPLVERLEYEHKKRILKNDFLNQLRNFQEREEQSLVRHKARLRAQYERHVEELIAELEKMRQARVEQEEALSVQMVEHIRQERDAKRNEAKRQVREELQQFEREVHERKALEIELISKAIQKEEDDLSIRLREVRQATREEELVRQQKAPGSFANATGELREQLAPSSPGEVVGRSTTKRRAEIIGENSNQEASDRTSTAGRRPKAESQQRSVRLTPSRRLERGQHRQKANVRAYGKWKQRLQEEVDLLVKARTLVANQRQRLTRQAQQLKASRSEWKRDSRTTRHADENPILREMNRMLDEVLSLSCFLAVKGATDDVFVSLKNMATWSEGMRKLREQESWLRGRKRKISKMEHSGSGVLMLPAPGA
ncbi:hypothetical protein BBJ28_00007039 [Nothophytophthora sp. Chile5]|nr:hypothetical protein BBJ28_00007039 [Nothophytophthora sp. Chile5]